LPTKKELEEFLQLIHPLPGYKILEVTRERSELSDALEAYLQDEGTLIVHEYGEEKVLKKPFRALPREYDVVILNEVLLAHSFSEKILKNTYTTLANAANVIIIEDESREVLELLEKCDFRAANEIEIFEGKKLIVAKKMHMWGNGL